MIGQAVLDAAAHARVEHVVTLSGLSAAHDPDSTSRQLERQSERFGLVWIYLWLNYFM